VWRTLLCLLVLLCGIQTCAPGTFSMVQVVGSAASSGAGFTNVVATAPVCQGVNAACGGSQVIYLSYQSGTDSGTPGSPGSNGTCTQAAPCKTLAYGCSLVRNGSADQLLLKAGDNWPALSTNNCLMNGTFNGLNACPGTGNWTVTGGGTCTGPLLFGYYGSGARPQIQLTTSTQPCWKQNGSGSSTFNNVVIQGWDCYETDRDPNNAAYTFAAAVAGAQGIVNSGGLTSWVLIEDVTLRYFTFDIILAGQNNSGTIVQNGTVTTRRSNLFHTYCPNCDSSGIFESFAATPYFLDNTFFVTGWDDILSKPQTVTVSGNTVTWPIANYAFNALPFGNGSVVYFSATCGSAVAGTGYTVASASGSTFVVQLGGSTVSLSGCSTATMMWGDVALQTRNHSVYLQVESGAAVATGNISLWSNDLKISTGGTIQGNLLSNDWIGISVGASAGSETGLATPAVTSLSQSGNVYQHALAFLPGTGGKFTYPGDGNSFNVGAFELSNASGSGVQTTHEIFSQLGTGSGGDAAVVLSCCVSSDTTNTVTQNILVYGASSSGAFNTIIAGSGNVTTPVFCVDLNQANSGCGSEPFANPLNDLFTYDTATWGTSCSGSGPANTCMTDFANRQLARLPGTWPANLTAGAVITHVKTGFGNPF
jgi:hypothetical protein